jgi:hypothetical protein
MKTLSTFASAMSTRVRRRFLCRYRFLLLTCTEKNQYV